jgi:hypothetical protein
MEQTKLIILYEQSLNRKEMKCLATTFNTICHISDFNNDKPILQLLHNNEVVLIDISRNNLLDYWSENKNIAKDCLIIYKHSTGVRIENIDDLKTSLNCKYVLKYLPTNAIAVYDYINKLSHDHISTSIRTPNLFFRLGRKILKFIWKII